MDKIIAVDSILSAWTGHKVFAWWLPEYLNAKVVVDLGVDYGFSTFCFALSANTPMVYGVDSFSGDEHTGTRNTYNEVMEFKEKYQFDNVTIINSDFSELAKVWDLSIDILHIDGLHTYEAVSHDFATWSKFIRDNTVVLFHDTEAFAGTVGRFFEELPYSKFNFTHSAGLGVMCKDSSILNAILDRCKNELGLSEVINVYS